MKITGNRGKIEHSHYFQDYEDCEFFLNVFRGKIFTTKEIIRVNIRD